MGNNKLLTFKIYKLCLLRKILITQRKMKTQEEWGDHPHHLQTVTTARGIIPGATKINKAVRIRKAINSMVIYGRDAA